MSRFAGSDNYFRDYVGRMGPRTTLKMEHYLDIYPQLLGHLRGKDISFLEIGIYLGGSMPMWQGYFGAGSTLVFADIDPDCRKLALEGTEIEIGDQADPVFLKEMLTKHGSFDVILDDGGHQMHQQTTSFRHLWSGLKDGGLYIVEDTHSSYWPGFGGGLRNGKSFIEFAKDLIDRMHSWYSDQDEIFPLSPLAQQIGYIHFYDSIVVVKKQLKEAPLELSASNGKVYLGNLTVTLRNRRCSIVSRNSAKHASTVGQKS